MRTHLSALVVLHLYRH